MDEELARAPTTIAMQIVAGGGVPDSAREYATAMLRRIVQAEQRPVRHAQVVLTLDADPAHQRGAFVEASLDVVGAPVRACIAAADLQQAIDQVGAALARRLDQQHERVRRRLRPETAATGSYPAVDRAAAPDQRVPMLAR